MTKQFFFLCSLFVLIASVCDTPVAFADNDDDPYYAQRVRNFELRMKSEGDQCAKGKRNVGVIFTVREVIAYKVMKMVYVCQRIPEIGERHTIDSPQIPVPPGTYQVTGCVDNRHWDTGDEEKCNSSIGTVSQVHEHE